MEARFTSIAAVLATVLACRDRPAAPPAAAPTEAAVAPVAMNDVDAAVGDGWTWPVPRKCLLDVVLPVPPGWGRREIDIAEGRCTASISPPERTGVNVERSTRSLDEFRAGATEADALGGKLVRSEARPGGWTAATSRFVYVHRDDLRITCIGLVSDEPIVVRVCAEARVAGG